MRIFDKNTIPILVTGIIGAGAGVGSFYALVDTLGNNNALIAGCLAGTVIFCALLVLVGFSRISRLARQFKKLEEGILAHEMRVNKKVEGFQTILPSIENLDKLTRKFSLDEHESIVTSKDDNINARSAFQDEHKGNLEKLKIKESDDAIPLEPDVPPPANAGASIEVPKSAELEPAKKKFSTDGMNIRLQPVVSMGTREIYAFEASICEVNRYGDVYDDATVRATLASDADFRNFDKFMAEKVVSLVRSFLRQEKSPIIFVTLSKATIESAPTFKKFDEMLEAQSKLKKNIVWEISQADFAALNETQRLRLRQILERKFLLCLSGFDKPDRAAKHLKSGLFHYAKMHAEELEKIEASASSNLQSDIMVAAKASKTTLIVTDVLYEKQAVHLIDHEIEYGQGDFFSPARFPATS